MMPRDAAQFYNARPDGHGGVRLIPKVRFRDSFPLPDPALDRAIREPGLPAVDRAVLQRIRDAMLPGASPPPTRRRALAKDQDPDEQEPVLGDDPRVIGELPAPPANMHYEIEARAEGVYAI